MSERWSASLSFLAGAIKAGMTLEEALALFEREAPEAFKSSLGKINSEPLAWLPFSQRVEKMFPGPDLVLARTALLLSQRVGGQAAPLLEQCAQNIQMKSELTDRLKALTAQGRMSAWVVGLTPLFLLLGFALFAWDYVAPLFQTARGLSILGLALLLIVLGLLMVHRISRLE